MADVAVAGKKVHVHYKGTFEDGKVFDSSEGKDPLQFELGAKQVIAGFEAAIEGMKAGEKKTIHLEADEAYGPHNPQLVQEVPKESLGEIKDKVKKDMIIGMHHPAAPQPIPARVIEVGDATIKIDLNPPLAGKALNFELELVKVE